MRWPVYGRQHVPAEAAFEPAEILTVLWRHQVPFVVIGGTAGFLYGSPLPTFDVDVVPPSDEASLTRLSGALRELDARVRLPDVPEGLPFGHDATSLASAVFWNLTTRYGDLDISFRPSGTEGYADLVRDSVEMDVGGVVVRVASLADVIRSKQAAGRPKDQRALPILREILERTTGGRRPERT